MEVNAAGESVYTERGIAIDPERLPELLTAVKALAELVTPRIVAEIPAGREPVRVPILTAAAPGTLRIRLVRRAVSQTATRLLDRAWHTGYGQPEHDQPFTRGARALRAGAADTRLDNDYQSHVEYHRDWERARDPNAGAPHARGDRGLA